MLEETKPPVYVLPSGSSRTILELKGYARRPSYFNPKQEFIYVDDSRMSYAVGMDAFDSKDEAIKHWEQRRKKKVESLERQLKRWKEAAPCIL